MAEMSTRIITGLFTLLLCLSRGSVATAQAESPRPDILLILLDDAGFMDFGVFEMPAGGRQANRSPPTQRRSWPRTTGSSSYSSQWRARISVRGESSGENRCQKARTALTWTERMAT